MDYKILFGIQHVKIHGYTYILLPDFKVDDIP